MLLSMLQIVPLLVVTMYAVVCELLDTKGRLEMIKKDHPKLWRHMNNRPARLILLGIAIGLLAKDFRDVAAVAPAPIVTFQPPQAPIIDTPSGITANMGATLEKKKRLEIRTHLSNLLGESIGLKTMCIGSEEIPDHPHFCRDAVNSWILETLKYIQGNLEPSYYSRFISATGLTMTYFGTTPERNQAVNILTFKGAALDEFLKEFLDH